MLPLHVHLGPMAIFPRIPSIISFNPDADYPRHSNGLTRLLHAECCLLLTFFHLVDLLRHYPNHPETVHHHVILKDLLVFTLADIVNASHALAGRGNPCRPLTLRGRRSGVPSHLLQSPGEKVSFFFSRTCVNHRAVLLPERLAMEDCSLQCGGARSSMIFRNWRHKKIGMATSKVAVMIPHLPGEGC